LDTKPHRLCNFNWQLATGRWSDVHWPSLTLGWPFDTFQQNKKDNKKRSAIKTTT